MRLLLALAPDSTAMRILRRTDDAFAGPDDPNAVLVGDDWEDTWLVDSGDDLTDGVQVWYRCFDWVDGAWVDQGISFAATPAVNFEPDGLDPQEFVRDRMQTGIAYAVAQNWLLPASGSIEVTTAPFQLSETVTFPTVSVHLESTGPADRAIGDSLIDEFDQFSGQFEGTEGWIARTSLNIVGVSQNPDERIQLRKVLRQVVQANLPVFAGAGLRNIEFSQTDSEEFRENNVPLYKTNGMFSCLSPAWIRAGAGAPPTVVFSADILTPGRPVESLGDLNV